jgi:hypothetical protein
MTAQLTVLNVMAGPALEASLDRQREWGLDLLDLKAIAGTPIAELTPAEAERVRAAADARGQSVHILSTGLFGSDVEEGEAAFRERHLPALENALRIAPILGPERIRLLAAGCGLRADLCDAVAHVVHRRPWLIELYREAVDRITEAGFEAVIENEVGHCIFGSPQEILAFFDALERPARARLIWDIQNLWQMGTFPSLQVYRILRPLIGSVHAKGGRAEHPGGPLRWKADLPEASWPVVPILSAAVADGVTPVVCLNPSHGEAPPGYEPDYARDLQFLRQQIPGIQ